jgi:prophage regulatory protein
MDKLHRIVRLADLPTYTGLRRTQIDALILRGEFPRPVKLSPRRKAWLEAELIEWQQRCIAVRDITVQSHGEHDNTEQ